MAVNTAFSSEAATLVFSLITRLGNGWVLAALIAIPMLLFDRRRARQHLAAMVIAVAAGGGLVTAAKVLIDRPRPAEHPALAGEEIHAPLGTPSDRSFPSGHTQTAFGAATYLACLYPAAAVPLLVAAAMVGLSRMALGVHFPADVLFGSLIGAALSLIAYHVACRRAASRNSGV
ncbi:MAG: phosphatase PAP2 family protein [Polyangia bacterium]